MVHTVAKSSDQDNFDVTDDQILSALRRPPVPWGARVVSIVGKGGTAADVLLMPGPGVDNAMRAEIVAAHPLVNCTICADLRPTPPMAHFHGATIRWAIGNADRISIWSPDEQLADEKDAADTQAVDAGANFILTIETVPAAAAEWAILACRYKRADAKLELYDDAEASRRLIAATFD
jgi:hypothetical protein